MPVTPWAACCSVASDPAASSANNAIGVIGPDRTYRVLISDPRLSWVDAFSFGTDGYLYTVANQLHRSAVLNGGESATKPPYLILRFKPLAAGTPGR